MIALPAMFIVWAVFAVGFIALVAYRGNLTRYEDDQLFLNDNNSVERELQTTIQTKLRKVEPLLRACGAATAVLTAGIAGVYVWDLWQKLQ